MGFLPPVSHLFQTLLSSPPEPSSQPMMHTDDASAPSSKPCPGPIAPARTFTPPARTLALVSEAPVGCRKHFGLLDRCGKVQLTCYPVSVLLNLSKCTWSVPDQSLYGFSRFILKFAKGVKYCSWPHGTSGETGLEV